MQTHVNERRSSLGRVRLARFLPGLDLETAMTAVHKVVGPGSFPSYQTPLGIVRYSRGRSIWRWFPSRLRLQVRGRSEARYFGWVQKGLRIGVRIQAISGGVEIEFERDFRLLSIILLLSELFFLTKPAIGLIALPCLLVMVLLQRELAARNIDVWLLECEEAAREVAGPGAAAVTPSSLW